MKKLVFILTIMLLGGSVTVSAQQSPIDGVRNAISNVLRNLSTTVESISPTKAADQIKNNWNQIAAKNGPLTIGPRPLHFGSENGTVFGQTKRTFVVTPRDSKDMEIRLNKTDGKAETIVYISEISRNYKSDKLLETYVFRNDKKPENKTFLLKNTSGKTLIVEIKNKSVGNTFKYQITAAGKGGGISSGSTNTNTSTSSSGSTTTTTTPPKGKGSVRPTGTTTSTPDPATAGTRRECDATIKTRNGTVYAGGPANITVRPSSSTAKVTIRKTDGRARTTVNIYVNGAFNSNLIFENRNSPETKVKNLTNVKNKEIKVEIINQSTANKFQYSASIDAKSESLLDDGNVTGNLAGQIKKTIESKGSCSGKSRVIIKRTGGNARGTVRVWKKNGNSWTEVESDTFETTQDRNQMVVNVNTTQPIKVELKNISVGNTFRYNMDIVAMQ